MRPSTIFPAFIAIISLMLCTFTTRAQIAAIKAGRLVTPETGTTANNQIILIESGKITAIGANILIPKGASVIDLSNATVMPGLFDAHTQLRSNISSGRV